MITINKTRCKNTPSLSDLKEYSNLLSKIQNGLINNDKSIFVFSISNYNRIQLKKAGYRIIKSSDGYWISWEKVSVWARFVDWVIG